MRLQEKLKKIVNKEEADIMNNFYRLFVKTITYEKKDGEKEDYYIFPLNEDDNNLYAIKLNDISEEDQEKLMESLVSLKQCLIDDLKKNHFRKFLKSNIVENKEE